MATICGKCILHRLHVPKKITVELQNGKSESLEVYNQFAPLSFGKI